MVCVCVHTCGCTRETERSGGRERETGRKGERERTGEIKEADIEVIVRITIPLHIPLWFRDGVRHSLLLALGWFQSPTTEINSGNPHTGQSVHDIPLSKMIGSQISLNEFRPMVYEDLLGEPVEAIALSLFGWCAIKMGYLAMLQPSCHYKARPLSVEINTMEGVTQKRKKKVSLILLLSHCSTEVLRLSSYVSN